MSTDEPYGKFVQFPLCLLARKETIREWWQLGLAYGVVHFLNATREPKTPPFESTGPKGTTAKRRESELDRARAVIGFDGGSAHYFLELYIRASERERAWTSAHGSSFPVRIGRALLFEAVEKQALTEAQIRIFLGLGSLIGLKDYAKAGWPMIQARAAGWLRPLTEDEKKGPDVGILYSRGQIDRACKELISRGLVSEFTYNGGERWWSHKLKPDELAEKIANRKTWRLNRIADQARRNADVSARINAIKKGKPAA